MSARSSRFVWWFVAAIVLLANCAAAVFAWLFVFDRVLTSDVTTRRLDVDIAINELRTSPLFPWLPTAELLVMPRERSA